jgi:hypothetical protein
MLLSLSATAYADWAITGVRVHCSKALGQLTFTAQTVSPEEYEVGVPEKVRKAFLQSALAEGLIIEGPHQLVCNLHGTTLTTRVTIYPPSERGECGANPGGHISIASGNQPILSVPIGNACFASAWSGTIAIPGPYADKNSRAGLNVCGYARLNSQRDKQPTCIGQLLSIGDDPTPPFELRELEAMLK